MNTERKWQLVWSPSWTLIGVVTAPTAKAAARKAPMPYRKYLGEIAVEPIHEEVPST